MPKPQIVIDTNVFVAAMRSRQGAAFRLLSLIDRGKFEVHISVPLILENEDAAKRIEAEIALAAKNIDDIIDFICAVAHPHAVYFLWRPFLKDPKDDMVLELAVTAGCDYLITYNKSDFADIERFGIRVMDAREFLKEIGEL